MVVFVVLNLLYTGFNNKKNTHTQSLWPDRMNCINQNMWGNTPNL